MTKEQFYIIGGKHAVIESIKNSKRYIKTIFANSEKNYQLIKSINQRNIKIELALGTSFNKLFIDNEFVHQGFAALVSPLENLDLETFIQSDLENKKRSVFIILDGIEDDRNIGSIIRSSSALGADGIIINKREFRNKSFHMHKTASGAMEYIPIFAVSNVVNAIDILKKNNFWIYAMDGKANNSIFKEKFSMKVSFVFGSESDGMRKIVLNHSDNILFIPMKNKIDSLNVSNAVAATLAIYNSIK
jgi:23S rRNA (guanosine2251-2'-O)-methyltransferase